MECAEERAREGMGGEKDRARKEKEVSVRERKRARVRGHSGDHLNASRLPLFSK